jgi:RNA polymerase sigma factor (sigma-70 family)
VAPEPPSRLTLRGDEAELFRRHDMRLRAEVKRFALTTDEVIEDACSHAWMELCYRQPERDFVFSWLRRVAIREAWRLRARDQREIGLDDVPSNREPQGIDLHLEVHAHDALRALAALRPRHRDFLTLKITGYSYDEIAQLRDTTPRTVQRQLVGARRHLRLVRDDD